MDRIKNVFDMTFPDEEGADGVLPAGAYVDTNGKLQANFTKKQMETRTKELIKDDMFSKAEANLLLGKYVSTNVLAPNKVMRFLGDKVVKLLKNTDKNITADEAQAKIQRITRILEKFEKFVISDHQLNAYGESTLLM